MDERVEEGVLGQWGYSVWHCNRYNGCAFAQTQEDNQRKRNCLKMMAWRAETATHLLPYLYPPLLLVTSPTLSYLFIISASCPTLHLLTPMPRPGHSSCHSNFCSLLSGTKPHTEQVLGRIWPALHRIRNSLDLGMGNSHRHFFLSISEFSAIASFNSHIVFPSPRLIPLTLVSRVLSGELY